MAKKKNDNETANYDRLKDAILKGKKVNLFDETFALDGVDDLMKDLDEDQKAQVRQGIVPIIDTYQSMIDILAETLQDPEKKNQFMKEVERRFAGN